MNDSKIREKLTAHLNHLEYLKRCSGFDAGSTPAAYLKNAIANFCSTFSEELKDCKPSDRKK
jgi:hypothetical protein